jgi:predicted phage tail protein
MATDATTSAAVAAEAQTFMSQRIPMESPPLAAAGLAVSAGSTAWSFLANSTGAVFGMVDAASLLSLGGAVLAIIFGGLIPKSLDAWQDYRSRKRAIDKADRDALAEGLQKMADLQEANLRYQRENASLQKAIKELLEQSSEKVLGEVNHVLRNVKHGNNLGVAVAGKIAEQVKGSLEQVAATAESTNRKVARVAQALSGSGIDLTATDPDMPIPVTPVPPEPKPS